MFQITFTYRSHEIGNEAVPGMLSGDDPVRFPVPFCNRQSDRVGILSALSEDAHFVTQGRGAALFAIRRSTTHSLLRVSVKLKAPRVPLFISAITQAEVSDGGALAAAADSSEEDLREQTTAGIASWRESVPDRTRGFPPLGVLRPPRTRDATLGWFSSATGYGSPAVSRSGPRAGLSRSSGILGSKAN